MSHPHLDPEALRGRYQNARSTLLSLWVTRQEEEFVIDNDERLCDIELVNAVALLVGNYDQTELLTYQNLRDAPVKFPLWDTSMPFGCEDPLSLDMFTTHVNVDVEGVTHAGHFMLDSGSPLNYNRFLVPTAAGLNYDISASQLPSKSVLEACRMQPRIKIHTYFPGTLGKESRKVRFLQDIVDHYGVFDPLSNPEGVIHGPNNNPMFAVSDGGGGTLPQFDGNVCTKMLLQFRVTPRVTY